MHSKEFYSLIQLDWKEAMKAVLFQIVVFFGFKDELRALDLIVPNF